MALYPHPITMNHAFHLRFRQLLGPVPPVWSLLFLALLGLTLVVRLGFVFWFSDYEHYLFSDFAGYWQRALDRLAGRVLDMDQWAIWPPLYHVLLAEWFKLIALFGLDENSRLPSVMVLNAMLGVVDVAVMVTLTRQLTGDVRLALLTGLFFGIGYPYLYFNAFVMSEHPAWTAFLVSLWLLTRHRARPGLAGLVLGIAIALRPAYGLSALVGGLYLLWGIRCQPWPRRWFKAAWFSLGLLSLLTWVLATNDHLSQGRLLGLGANGGVTFYFASCRTHRVETRHDGYHYVLEPAPTVDRPEYGLLQERVPFYQQGHYFRLGWECLLKDGLVAWFNGGTFFYDVLFGPLFPAVGSVSGFPWAMDVHRPLLLIALLLVPFAPMALPAGPQRERSWLLLGNLIMLALTFNFFNVEHRYLYSLAFLIVPLGVVALQQLLTIKRLMPMAILYGSLVFLVLVYGAVLYWVTTRADLGPPRIKLALYAGELPSEPMRRFQLTSTTHQALLPTVDFPHGAHFRHRNGVDFGELTHAFGELQFEFVAAQQVDLAWQLAADDQVELYLDGLLALSSEDRPPYQIQQVQVRVEPGLHRGRIRYLQAGGWSGLTAVYRPIQQPAGRHFAYVGEDAYGLRFLPVEH